MEPVKMIVWPRGPKEGPDGKTYYAYAVVGVIISPRPLEGLEGNEFVIESSSSGGMLDALETLPKRSSNVVTSDANDVLVRLDEV